MKAQEGDVEGARGTERGSEWESMESLGFIGRNGKHYAGGV